MSNHYDKKIVFLTSLNASVKPFINGLASMLNKDVRSLNIYCLEPNSSLTEHFQSNLTNRFDFYTNQLNNYLVNETYESSNQYLIGITDRPMHGWFSYTDCPKQVCIITTFEWPQNAVNFTIESYLIYQICQNLLLLLVGGKSFLMHEETRGCLFDFCEYKPDINVGMEKATICNDCRRRIDIMGYSNILNDLLNAYRQSKSQPQSGIIKKGKAAIDPTTSYNKSKFMDYKETIDKLFDAQKYRRWRDAIQSAESVLSNIGIPPISKVHALVGKSEGYMFMGDLINALECLDAAWDICWEQRIHRYFAPINYRQAECYLAMGDPMEAFAYFKRAMDLRKAEQVGLSDDPWLWDFGGMIRALVEQNKITEAHKLLNEYKKEVQSGKSTTALRAALLKLMLAEGKYKKCLEIAENLRRDALAERDLPLAGQTTTIAVVAALELNDPKRALALLSSDDAHESLIPPWLAAESHYLKGKALTALQKEKDALKEFLLAAQIHQNLRFTTFRVTGIWTKVDNWTTKLYDIAIDCALNLNKHDEAFWFAYIKNERLKAYQFSATMVAKKRRGDTNIESKIADHEKRLIQKYDLLISELKKLSQPISKEEVLERIFSLHEQQYELERWKNQKLDWPPIVLPEKISPIIKISQLQNHLSDGELILLYHMTDEDTLCWSINRQNHKLTKFACRNNEIHKHVGNLQLAVQQYFDSKESWESLFYSSLNNLSTILLPDILDMIHEANRIIVIPDGSLNYLPFEMLIEDISPINSGSNNHKMLIENNNRSFVYIPISSVIETFQQKDYIMQNKAKVLACIACPESIDLGSQPEFKNDELQFVDSNMCSDLTGTIKECLTIGRVFDDSVPQELDHPSYSSDTVEIHTGAYHATKDWLKRCGEDFNIIHIASHAYVNNAFPGVSGIILHGWLGSTMTERILYQFELQSLNLETDMVILSCCSTAQGEFSRGEGVLGLAQSLWLAGVKSSITTLWDVVDNETQLLMETFYKQLQNGLEKDVALAEAKRKAIAQKIPPPFWAQFIFSGNWSPLFLQKGKQ